MKKIFVFAAILSAALVSCSKEAETENPNEVMFQASSLFTVETKAVPVEYGPSGNFTAFNVSATTGTLGSETAVATFQNIPFTGSYNNRYKGNPTPMFWPNEDPGYHFYASNNSMTFGAAGTTVNAVNDKDVVCAFLATSAHKSVNALAFEHVFARIGTVTVTAEAGYTITDVTLQIKDPKTGGVYNLRTKGWSSETTGAKTTLFQKSTIPNTNNPDLYLIPGTYTMLCSWTATKGSSVQSFVEKECNVTLEGGKINELSTDPEATGTKGLGGNASEIEFTVTVSPWTSVVKELTFSPS